MKKEVGGGKVGEGCLTLFSPNGPRPGLRAAAAVESGGFLSVETQASKLFAHFRASASSAW